MMLGGRSGLQAAWIRRPNLGLEPLSNSRFLLTTVAQFPLRMILSDVVNKVQAGRGPPRHSRS